MIPIDRIDPDWVKRGRTPPDEFHAAIGNGYAGYYTVELRDDGSLVWSLTGRNAEPPVIVTPTPEQWSAFSRALDTADVWEWKDCYEDKTVIDGTYWEVSIRSADREVRSDGANAYPPRFRSFLRAVSRLVGGRPFE